MKGIRACIAIALLNKAWATPLGDCGAILGNYLSPISDSVCSSCYVVGCCPVAKIDTVTGVLSIDRCLPTTSLVGTCSAYDASSCQLATDSITIDSSSAVVDTAVTFGTTLIVVTVVIPIVVITLVCMAGCFYYRVRRQRTMAVMAYTPTLGAPPVAQTVAQAAPADTSIQVPPARTGARRGAFVSLQF